ncbi:MAG: hypothetical protein E5X88_30895 [Mesorhizobium sp.]|nr:MAG: hypothetical protein E5X88_30895 [Mesorhizobium sp.]
MLVAELGIREVTGRGRHRTPCSCGGACLATDLGLAAASSFFRIPRA